MNYILFNKEDNALKLTSFDMVYDDLYYDKANVPTKEQIKSYIKNKNNDKHILNYFQKYNNDPNIIRFNIKDNISSIEYKIPLYDEYTKNLYIIKKEDVYDK